MPRHRGRAAALVALSAALTSMLTGARPPADPAEPGIAAQRQELARAKSAADLATRRAEALAGAAAAEQGAARRAQRQEAAAAARVASAEADLSAGRARVALVGELLNRQRARLAAEEAPVARLLGGLASLARAPALAGLARPGSIDDVVHLRAVIGSVVPSVRARTAGIRAQVAATRALEADAALSAAALADDRARLEERRAALAGLEARHATRATALNRSALAQGDRAIALGEQARDMVDAIAESGGRQATMAELGTLPTPPLPAEATETALAAPPAYRLPAQGRLVTGFGELSPAGVRSRGLTLAVAPGLPIRAPAAGRVVYARPFRGWGLVVILDHGDGWTSLLTGLGTLATASGASVEQGGLLGTAATGQPRITLELRRRGRPIDPVYLL